MSEVIPSDWHEVTLGDHAHIKARIGWRGLSSSEYQEIGPYLIAGTHIKGAKIDWDNCDHIDDFRYEESPEIQLRDHDVVISKDGTIGRLGFIEKLPGPATINGTMMLIRPDESLHSKFVYFYLQGDKFQKIVKEKVSGSSVPHIFQRDMVALSVPRPPIMEQQKIATILSSVDDVIEKTRAQIDKLKNLKTGMMQELLTKGIGLGGAPYTEFKDSPMGQIPGTWDVVALGDLAVFNSGYAFKSHELSEEGMKVIRISNLHKPNFPYWRYDGSIKKTWIVEKGDILFSWAGVANSINVHRYMGEKALLNQHIYNFKFESEELKLWTYQILKSLLPHLKASIEGGAGQLHLTKSFIQAIPIPLPPIDERTKISQCFQSIDDRISLIKVKENQFHLVKKALMQDLLTGNVRVNVEKKEAVVA